MKSKLIYTKEEAEEIKRLIEAKLKADSAKQRGIRAKIRKLGFRASEFGFRDGYTVAQFLSVVKITGTQTTAGITNTVNVHIAPSTRETKATKTRMQSDESYVIDLCDEVLQLKAFLQHRFDFLKGDAGTKLPVDAYYPTLKLVVEFRERQHTEDVKFFDRRQTGSGVGRGEQRKLYDQRRRELLPKNGIQLLEIGYDDFEHSSKKKLFKNREADLKVIREKLKNWREN